MVKQLDFRLLSPATREEIFRVAGITDEDREWLRARSSPVGVLELEDTYKVSRAQQKKAYALLQAICKWSGYTPLETEKTLTKQMFISSQMPTLADTFSLADCSREVARLYITYLIDFCLLHDIPCGEPLYKLCEDIAKYIIACLYSRKCAVCGKPADIHHCDGDRVGMGNNRDEVHHLGRRVLPLCRAHHDEAHHDEKGFIDKYHLQPITLDKDLCKRLKLKE